MKLLPLLLLAVCGSVAAQNAFVCEGPVSQPAIEANTGDVFAAAIGPLRWARLCNVNNTANNISPAACKVVYTTLVTASVSGKNVHVAIGDSPSTSCATHQEWSWLTGFYFLKMVP